jgi:hypothetical protein
MERCATASWDVRGRRGRISWTVGRWPTWRNPFNFQRFCVNRIVNRERRKSRDSAPPPVTHSRNRTGKEKIFLWRGACIRPQPELFPCLPGASAPAFSHSSPASSSAAALRARLSSDRQPRASARSKPRRHQRLSPPTAAAERSQSARRATAHGQLRQAPVGCR